MLLCNIGGNMFISFLNICIYSCLAFFIICISSIKKIPENIAIIANIIIWYTILNIVYILFSWFVPGSVAWIPKLLVTIIVITLLIYRRIKNGQGFIFLYYNKKNKPIIITTVIIYLITVLLIFGLLLLQNAFHNVDNFIFYFITFAILVGICEELYFRGFIYNKLLVLYKGKKIISIIVCSIMFGIIHIQFFRASFLQNMIYFISPFLQGILLGFLYEKSKNIMVPIMIHNVLDTIGYVGLEYFFYIKGITLGFRL